ncbi:hypothetical protein PV325_012835 [Microctonus aethiopoides]|nr:hypothetical protein PV325_012835 [Microctonus aethiopoides]
MASKKTRQNHSIQHLLELPSTRSDRSIESQQSEQQSTIRAIPRQVPVTILHPTPKKFPSTTAGGEVIEVSEYIDIELLYERGGVFSTPPNFVTSFALDSLEVAANDHRDKSLRRLQINFDTTLMSTLGKLKIGNKLRESFVGSLHDQWSD